jgi:hypothetical protein
LSESEGVVLAAQRHPFSEVFGTDLQELADDLPNLINVSWGGAWGQGNESNIVVEVCSTPRE